MAVDILPDEIVVRDRAELVNAGVRAYLVKRPNDIINDGTWQHAIISAVADMLLPQSLNARTIGRSIPDEECSGLELDRRLSQLRLPERFGQTGSTGYVAIVTSGGGVTINAGDLLSDEGTNTEFRAVTTGTYDDGDPVQIVGVSTGPSTNLDEDTILTWSSPAVGLSPTATVLAPGLTGGRLSESDEQVRLRIKDARSDPAASGNAATYIRLAENAGAHGVPVQKAFVIESTNGPGSIALAFVLTSAGPGTSRRPTPAQIASVRAYIASVPEDETRIPPGDDILLDTTLLAQPVSIVLDVRWSKAAANWQDSSSWPVRHDEGDGAIVVSAATDATHFTLARDAGSYVGEAQPAIGQTVCFYDLATGTFARKRILSFTGTGPWVITVDTTNDSSNTTYVPVVGQRASPWSKSLDDIATPVLDYFDKLGPGEQFANVDLFDPGKRMRRNPQSPESWPSLITSHLESLILDVPAVGDAILREGQGVSADIGTPGVTAYLLELGDIAVFPLVRT